jgi:hypothetical protein
MAHFASCRNEDGLALIDEGGVEVGDRWRFLIVCKDGAYCREDIELKSTHLSTISYGSIVDSSEKKFNEMGLARLRISSGWISEMLNPLSGQTGKIAELVPLLVPLRYRVIIPEGALVRRGIELSSPVVQVIPCGEYVDIIEKKWSDHPSACCVPRLRLLNRTGWISLRTVKGIGNEKKVLDELVVEYVEPTPNDIVTGADTKLLPDDDKTCPESVKLAHAVSELVESGQQKPSDLTDPNMENLLCIVCMVNKISLCIHYKLQLISSG